MSLSAQLSAQRDALGEAVLALRKALTNAKADILRTESALAGLGGGSDAGQLLPAISQAQRIFEDGVAVNLAATTAEHHLGVIAALKAAGSSA